MTKIEQALFSISQNDATLFGLIGVRFYNGLADQQPTYPFCVYHLISETVPNAMGGGTDLVTRRYQVDCWDTTAKGAKTLADAVQAAFDRYSGDPGGNTCVIQDIYRKGATDLFDEQARRFKRAVDLEVWYLE